MIAAVSIPVGKVPKAWPNPGTSRVGQPGRDKRIGHRGIPVTDEQGALESERQALGELAGASLRRAAELLTQPGHRLIQPAVRARGLTEFGEERLGHLWLAGQARSASSAATLPEPSQMEASAPHGRAGASPIPPRSRCRPGIPAPRRRARGRVCIPSTWSPPGPGGGTRLRPGHRGPRGRSPRPAGTPPSSSPPTRSRGRPARWPSAAGRPASAKTVR